MRANVVAAWLQAAVILSSVALAAQQPAAGPQSNSEVQQLRQTLLDQLGRLDKLGASQASIDPSEVASLKVLLAETNKRIAALEEAQAMAVQPPPAGRPAPSPPPPLAPSAVQASAGVEAPAEHKTTGPEKEPWMPDFYGSLRPRWGIADTAYTAVGDRFSRVGLVGKYPVTPRVFAVAKIELGLNLATENQVISGNEHGYAVGQGSQAVTTRLGYGGFQTPYGTVTFGKQWGVYYDIAQWTDNFFTLGGDASGAYAVGDGGISGTGRAETAAQYRYDMGWVHLGLQVQERSRTSQDKKIADTWGASLRFDLGKEWQIGFAWNEVLDGVSNPQPNEPNIGDTTAVVGAIWTKSPWTLAATYDESRNHEVDDLGNYFNACGWEMYGQFDFNSKWSLEFGFNLLQPRDERAGDYRILYCLLGVNYNFGKSMTLNAEYRYDQSRKSDGTNLRAANVVILGMNWGWGK